MRKILLVFLALMLCSTVYAKSAKPAVKSKVCSDYTCINNQLDTLKKTAFANTNLRRGSIITFIDQVSMSSGNFLADGLFGANSVYKFDYTARVEDFNLEEDRITVTIMDGKMSRVKDSSYQVSKFEKYLNEQRGSTKNYSIVGLLNTKLWDKFSNNDISTKDINETIVLYFSNLGATEMDTVAQIMAKLGYPRFSLAVFDIIINDANKKGGNASSYSGKADNIKSNNGLTGMDSTSTEWIKELSKEITDITKAVKKSNK